MSLDSLDFAPATVVRISACCVRHGSNPLIGLVSSGFFVAALLALRVEFKLFSVWYIESSEGRDHTHGTDGRRKQRVGALRTLWTTADQVLYQEGAGRE